MRASGVTDDGQFLTPPTRAIAALQGPNETVPVLRCGNTETMVRLTIRIHQADDGAELDPTPARVV
jgi:hypothetical protein